LDRLIDIVCDSAGPGVLSEADLLALKKRGFMQILDAEAPHLPNSGELIAELRADIAALAVDPEPLADISAWSSPDPGRAYARPGADLREDLIADGVMLVGETANAD
jgi:hypothetical protein